MIKPRGRPKLYDEEAALRAAGAVFWEKGYSGTSLDDLAGAMGMNRPSIYRAFGNKESLYRQTLAQFASLMEAGFRRNLADEPDIRKGLRAFYRGALNAYTAKESSLGCMVMCTAPAAATTHKDVQNDLLAAITDIDEKLRQRLEEAKQQGQIDAKSDTSTLSKLFQAVLHSLAIRARAGETKASLKKFADAAVGTILLDA